MNQKQRKALEKVCRTQEDLQAVWDKPELFKFGSRILCVTLCVAEDGPNKELVWAAAVRIANPKKQNFKSVVLWSLQEKLKARAILLNELEGIGAVLGEEEFASKKAMHINKRLTTEERNIMLRPHILGG